MYLLLAIPAFADDPPAWLASRAEVSVHYAAGEPVATVEVRYDMVPVRPGWFDAVLLGPQLVVSEVEGPLGARPEGLGLVLGPETGLRQVSAKGTVLVTGGELHLPIFPAAVEKVTVESPGLDVVVDGATDGVLRASSSLNLHFVPHRTESPTMAPPLVRAQVGTAFWEEEGALRVAARVKFAVLRGEQQQFQLDLGGLQEVEIEGPGVGRWERKGNLVILEAREMVRSSLEVVIRGQAPLPGGTFTVPAPLPVNVQRSERWYALGRSAEVELAPAGGRTVSGRQVPGWVTSMSETSPTVWWQGEAPQLTPLRYQPELGPDTVVERAELLVVANDVGSVLLRSTWYVRNERRQYLHFRPSAGFVPVAARRGSESVKVLSDGEGGLYVALERSLETVQGLMAMPVEVTWIGKGEDWKKRGSYRLELPSVDAPVQSVAWEVHLPRGYKAVRHRGAVEDYAPVFDAGREQAQDAVYHAVQSYRENDFDTAQVWLNHARSLGATDENAERLQSNLDLLLGNTVTSSNTGSDDAAARRVRDLANARSSSLRDAQAAAEKEAKDALAEGDLEEAEKKLEEVTRAAELLQRVEQAGSEEQRDRYAAASSSLADVREKRKQAERPRGKASGSKSNSMSWDDEDLSAADDKPDTTIEFENLEIDGELVRPDTGAVANGDNLGQPLETPPVPETPPKPEPVTVNEVTVAQSETVMTQEFLSRVPVGRSYQSVSSVAPGTTRRSAGREARKKPADAPMPVADPTPPAAVATPLARQEIDFQSILISEDLPAQGLGGMGTRGMGSGGGGQAAPVTSDTKTDAGYLASPEDEERTAPPPPKPSKPARNAGPRGNRPESTGETTPEAPAPANPNRRLEFSQRPTPLTLALPLEGEAVYRSQALLEPGTHPVLTIVYRRGEP